jgi:threonine synthase
LFVENDDLQLAASVQTFSNAMDVASPNNLPRLMQLFERKGNVSKSLFQAAKVSDEDTIRTIKHVYRDTGYLLDPHTAVAWHASEIVPSPSPYSDVIVSTASPLKFAEEILEKTGIRVDNTAELVALHSQPERYTKISNSYTELAHLLRDTKY